jgi:hypothetical protein
VPPGIEFACPHCLRVSKVPASFAGKQGRCAGCKKVIEVPATGPVTGGRTPDPEEGLLEVLDAKRASERTKRASTRSPFADVPDDVPAPPPEESTAKIAPPPPPKEATEKGTTYVLWAAQVPPLVWIGFALSFPFPALGIALSVLSLKRARIAGAGLRLAWAGIVVGSLIMGLNLAYLFWKVTTRTRAPGAPPPELPAHEER